MARMKCPVSFVESSQQNLTEQQIPNAIVDFFKAYMLCCQHLADKEPASLEPNRFSIELPVMRRPR